MLQRANIPAFCLIICVASLFIKSPANADSNRDTHAEDTAKLSEARAPNLSDPKWVYQSHSHPDTALIFVHGIFGDTLGTWLNKKAGKHFYDLIAEDPQFADRVDIFAFGYPSYMLKAGSFDISQAAKTLDTILQSNGLYSYKRLVFAAHSMGGLVVMQYLLTYREYLPRVPVVVFFSTPQEGSDITKLATGLLVELPLFGRTCRGL